MTTPLYTAAMREQLDRLNEAAMAAWNDRDASDQISTTLGHHYPALVAEIDRLRQLLLDLLNDVAQVRSSRPDLSAVLQGKNPEELRFLAYQIMLASPDGYNEPNIECDRILRALADLIEKDK